VAGIIDINETGVANCKSWAAAHYIKLIVQSVGQTTPPRPAKVVD
jgi:hypothetical protein